MIQPNDKPPGSRLCGLVSLWLAFAVLAWLWSVAKGGGR